MGNRFFAHDSEGGALPTLFAAVEDLPGASYVGPNGLGEQRGAPPSSAAAPRPATRPPPAARRLWTVSEELTGVPFPERLSAATTSA